MNKRQHGSAKNVLFGGKTEGFGEKTLKKNFFYKIFLDPLLDVKECVTKVINHVKTFTLMRNKKIKRIEPSKSFVLIFMALGN